MATVPAVLTIPQTAVLLGISRASVYPLIHSNELEATDVGTGGRPRLRVFEDSVTAFLSRRALRPAKRRTSAMMTGNGRQRDDLKTPRTNGATNDTTTAARKPTTTRSTPPRIADRKEPTGHVAVPR